MQIKAIKTGKIVNQNFNICDIVDQHIPKIATETIVAVSSKIVSICEGNVVKADGVDEQELVKQQAEYYIPAEQNRYGFALTINHNMIIPNAGIDTSNGNGFYILWPKDPQASANMIREHLAKKHGLDKIGVVITDSKTTPLRWGVTGVALAHSGFATLNNYIGKPDLFGRTLEVTKANIADGIAAAAVLVMGEGDEQTPLALVTDLLFVQFQHRNPTADELKSLVIDKEDDLYGPLLNSVKWHKGNS